jgi:hypothetical protein
LVLNGCQRLSTFDGLVTAWQLQEVSRCYQQYARLSCGEPLGMSNPSWSKDERVTNGTGYW